MSPPTPPATYNAAILTLSDRGAAGERPEDLIAAAIRQLLAESPVEVAAYEVLSDVMEHIEEALRRYADREDVQLVLTTGGTGLSPRDVTPQATLAVVEYEVPGVAEAMRAEGSKHTPMAMLSRAVVGVRSGALIVNLPGSPTGVRESLGVLLPALPHALEKLAGDPADCAPPPSTAAP